MLQIATVKLFSRPVGWENLLRGMLYTSANLGHEVVVETAVGSCFHPPEARFS